jgi:hypothetical protein
MRSLPTIALALALSLPAVAAFAQPTRIRGTIASLNGQTLVVNARNGQPVTVMLADKLTVTSSTTTSLTEVHPGSFIGTTAIPQPDGTMKALEVHVFPESMRGTGEGFRPWDLGAQSTMTNGTVGQIEGSDGRSLTVKYKEGEKKVTVPPDVPVVALEIGSRDELTPGAHVFIIANKAADGTVTTGRVTVGKNGLEPPM